MAGKTVIISTPAQCGIPALGPYYWAVGNVAPGTYLTYMQGNWPLDPACDIEPRDGRLDLGWDGRLTVGKSPLTNGRRNYRAWLFSGRSIDFVMEITDSPPKSRAELNALAWPEYVALCQLVP